MNQTLRRIIVWILLGSLLIGVVPVVALNAFADGGHTAAEGWQNNETHHWHACEAAGCTDHTGADAHGYAAHEYSVKDFSEPAAEDNTYYFTCECGHKGTQTYKAYPVTFVTEHGTAAPQTVVENECAAEPTEPTAEGYRFVQWETDGNAWDFTTEITEPTTLTAKWERVYTVSIAANPRAEALEAVTEAAPGETVTVTAQAKPGYEITELTANGNAFEGSFTMPEENVTIAAQIAVKEVKLEQTSVATLFVGASTTLTVEHPALETVTWQTSDAEVATVTDGVVTGIAPGQATITAKVQEGQKEFTADCPVTVAELAFTAQNRTVSGKVNTDLTQTTVTLTLTDGTLKAKTASNFTAADFQVNTPAGVSFTAERTGSKTIRLTFTGKPTAVKSEAMTIQVSKALVEGAPGEGFVTVTANENTKWEILTPHTVSAANDAASALVTSNLPTEGFAKGETVTFTPQTSAPFYVRSVSTVPAATVSSQNGTFSFTMPDENVTVKFEVAIESVTTIAADKSYAKSFSISDAVGLSEAVRSGSGVTMSKPLSEAQKDALDEGGSMNFLFRVTKYTSESDKKALEEQAITNDKCKLAHSASSDLSYIDISLYVRVYDKEGKLVGDDSVKITDTGSYMVDAVFSAYRSPANRLYYIHENHDVKKYLRQAGGSSDGNVIFEDLTQFSTYVLVRTTTETPGTGDSFPLEALLAAFCLSCLGITVLIARRKRIVE